MIYLVFSHAHIEVLKHYTGMSYQQKEKEEEKKNKNTILLFWDEELLHN